MRPRAIVAWIELLASTDDEVVHGASYALLQRHTDLAPFEAQLREVQPRANERVQGPVSGATEFPGAYRPRLRISLRTEPVAAVAAPSVRHRS